MATAEKSPKRSGLGLVTKLALWAVVIAFGYLYLSSVDRGSGNVSTPSTTQSGGSDSTLTAAPEEGGSVFEQVVDVLGDVPGMVVDLAGSAGELATAAKPYVIEAASATMDGAKFVVAQVKDLAGLTDASDESAAADTGSAQSASAASGGEMPPAGSVTTETAPAEATTAQAPVAGSSTGTAETEAVPAVAESASAGPATVAPMVSAERPQSPGFDRHFAPIRTAPPAAAPAEPAAAATATASTTTAEPAKTVPVSEAEATVFAESLMRSEATPPAVSGQAPSVPATSDQAGAMAAAAPAAPTAPPVAPPTAPSVAAPPASFGSVPPVSTMAMPEPIQPTPSSVPAAEPPVDVFAQERARRQADYEAMRRAAEQRARAYWEQRPVAPPIGAYPGGYAPPFGAAPYAPGYVPAPYPYAR